MYCSLIPGKVFQLASLWVNNFQNLSDLQQWTWYPLAAAGRLVWAFFDLIPGFRLRLGLCFKLGKSLGWDLPFLQQKEGDDRII